MKYQVKVEWQDEDGGKQSVELGTVEAAECQSATDVGLKLSSGKEFLARLQEIVVRRYRTRQIDTVFGRILIETPRYEQ